MRWDDALTKLPSLPQPHYAIIHNCDLCFYFLRILLSLSSFHMICAPSFSLRLYLSLTHTLSLTLFLSLAHSLTHTLSLTLFLSLAHSLNHCPTFLFSLSSANSRGGGGGGVDFLGCMPINLSRRNLMNVQRYAR